MGSKLDFGHCRIHAQSRLREHISLLRNDVGDMVKELAHRQVIDDAVKLLLMRRKRSQCIRASEKINKFPLL
jgi:AmiR/NasT family two-component response regulator